MSTFLAVRPISYFPFVSFLQALAHIFNNIASKVHSALSWWEKFMDGYRSFAYLLHHDHLRQRIVGLLMLGT